MTILKSPTYSHVLWDTLYIVQRGKDEIFKNAQIQIRTETLQEQGLKSIPKLYTKTAHSIILCRILRIFNFLSWCLCRSFILSHPASHLAFQNMQSWNFLYLEKASEHYFFDLHTYLDNFWQLSLGPGGGYW